APPRKNANAFDLLGAPPSSVSRASPSPAALSTPSPGPAPPTPTPAPLAPSNNNGGGLFDLDFNAPAAPVAPAVKKDAKADILSLFSSAPPPRSFIPQQQAQQQQQHGRQDSFGLGGLSLGNNGVQSDPWGNLVQQQNQQQQAPAQGSTWGAFEGFQSAPAQAVPSSYQQQQPSRPSTDLFGGPPASNVWGAAPAPAAADPFANEGDWVVACERGGFTVAEYFDCAEWSLSFSLNDEQLEEALAQRSSATKALLGRLLELFPSDSALPKVEELQSSCQSLLDQSLRSQEALRLLRVEHETTLAQLEETHTDLLRAEKRLDRARSTTVAAIEGRSVSSKTESSATASQSTKRSVSFANGSGGKAESHSTGVSGNELEELRSLAESRAKDIEELRHDRVSLKMDIDALKAKLVELPDDIVAESIPFRLLQSHVQTMTGEYDTKLKEVDKAQKEADGLREGQESFRQMIFREAEELVDDIQKRLVVRETDLTRIRSQREDARAEATELRARESEKVKNLDQLKTLASSREDRIAAYASEVRRLKMEIAAKEGDATSVDLYAGAEEADIVKDLQGRLKTAEDLLLALRDQVRSYSSNRGTFDSQTIAKSETDARLELGSCRDRLAKLEELLGPEGDVELRDLAERLAERDKKLEVLEAQLKAQDHATNMLYGEIDQLSTAWSTLDEQNNLKVFNLLNLEEKVQRLNAEKAKSDNRYFATMRQKDAIAAENQVLTKLAEKQQRAVDAATDLQHSLGSQLTAAEREITLQQKHVRAHQDSLAAVRRENAELAMRTEQNGKHITELNSLLADRISQAESEMANRKRSEEQAARVERELRASKPQTVSSGSESSEIRELKKYNEDLSCYAPAERCIAYWTVHPFFFHGAYILAAESSRSTFIFFKTTHLAVFTSSFTLPTTEFKPSRPPTMRQSTLFAAALPFLPLAQAATLNKEYKGASFFDGWTFTDAADTTTHGQVQYVSQATAHKDGLAYVNSAGKAIIGIDDTTNLSSGALRNSVRITSKESFSLGTLVVADFSHVPTGCSTWPAFWSEFAL
ncbi:E3 ubiquitin-protein ligase BRE1, partial [Phenoliferia sp. Uapishka_3]